MISPLKCQMATMLKDDGKEGVICSWSVPERIILVFS